MGFTVKIGRGILPNPVGAASGTFGYAKEYSELIDISSLGAVYTKAVTLEPRPGNDIPRLVETSSGLLNSIGLANGGVAVFIEEKQPYLKEIRCPVVINIAGGTEDDYCNCLGLLEEKAPLWGYEINISCPNVKTGGLALGTDPKLVRSLTGRLRDLTNRPLILKLTPNVTDITEIAKAAEDGGADAVSCINTLLGMVIDVQAKKPVLPLGSGGLSGPAILPVGVSAVYRVSRAVSIPVIGIGGIMTAEDAIQYLLAGASAVQIGTANFVEPEVAERVLEGIRDYMANEGLNTIEDFHRFIP